MALMPAHGGIFLRAKAEKGQLNSAQPMWLYEGIVLLGCTAAVRRGIRNNCLYTVESLGEEEVLLKDEADQSVRLSYVQVAAWCRLSFARTYASIQGTEFPRGGLRLHDVENSHFTMRHLFVAVSRAHYKEQISIAS